MTKRTVLTVDFSTKEIKALELALNTTKTDVTLTPTTINRLKPESYSDANLVVVKLNNDDSKNEDLIRKVKQYFLHFPIILLTERHLSTRKSSFTMLITLSIFAALTLFFWSLNLSPVR